MSKQIELKKINENIDYAGLIKLVLDNPPREGFTLSEMKRRLEVEEALTTALNKAEEPKVLILTDQQFECLKQCVHNMRWAARNRELIEFLELFEPTFT